MTDRDPERNESTDEALWLDLVARLEETPDFSSQDSPPEANTSADAKNPYPPVDPADGAEDVSGTDSGTGSAPEPADPPLPPPLSPPLPTAAERTRAIFDNQPFRAAPPRGPRDYDEPEELESEGEFVPPEPPPLGSGEPLVVLAWLGAIGGPLLLLVFAMFWRGAPLALVLGVIALFAASAGYLLFRLPSHHDDDGAEV